MSSANQPGTVPPSSSVPAPTATANAAAGPAISGQAQTEPDASAAMKRAWHQHHILADRPPPVAAVVTGAAAASATGGPSIAPGTSSQAPLPNPTPAAAPGSMRSFTGTQQPAAPAPQHVTAYATNPSASSSSAFNTPHSSLPPPPPIPHLQPHTHQSASLSSRSMPLPHAAPMHPGPSALSYGHHHPSHHGQYAPGGPQSSTGSAAVMPAPSQVLPTPPPPGTVRLDDYMIAMEARFLSSQDKYYDKAVRELDKYIRDLQDDVDNELNLALHDQCAIIQERVYQHQLHLEYSVSQAELMYNREIEASQAQLEAESEATKQKMLSELAIKKRRLEEERSQDVFSINLDNLDSTPGSRPNRAVRKTNKRGVHDDGHGHGAGAAGGHGHGGARKKHIKQSSLLGPPKLDDDEVNEDLVMLRSLTGMEVHVPPPVAPVGKGGRGAAGKRKG